MYKVPLALQRTLQDMGVFDGDTISQVKARIEAGMKLLNDAQRRKLLQQLGVILGKS